MATLGALLIDSAAAWLRIAERLQVEHFDRPDHRLIFAAITELMVAGKAADVITVERQLQQRGELTDAGGIAYLARLADETPSADNVDSYADIVVERARMRRLLAVSAEVDAAARDGTASSVILARLQERLRAIGAKIPEVSEPLSVEPVSTWAARPAPAARDWVIEGLIPARRVTSFMANGGDGKTTIALQVGLHVAMGRSLFGQRVSGGLVLGVFCEDEEDELQRRLSAACATEQVDLEEVDRFVAISREGDDNLLCTFDRDLMVTTPFYATLEATLARLQPRLLILDTLADLFGGDLMSTPHVRQFIKTALGGLCVRHGCGVLLIAHPSATGMSSGDGGGFSTAWHNSVRSRLYMNRPSADDPDRRVLAVKKANYAAGGLSIPLIWRAGAFVSDGDPVQEAAAAPRMTRVDTRLTVATMDCLRAKGPGGAIVSFGAIFEHLKAAGALSGDYEKERKSLNRALKALETDHLIAQSTVPRGYRILPPSA